MNPEQEVMVSESWKKTLRGLPSVLSRLAYLAGLRNPNTGTYEHFGFAQRFGGDVADRIMRGSHSELFQAWLCFNLERQKSELQEYFLTLEQPAEDNVPAELRTVVTNWLTLAPYMTWVPADTRDVERTLFYSDLEVILELIRLDAGVAARDPDL